MQRVLDYRGEIKEVVQAACGGSHGLRLAAVHLFCGYYMVVTPWLMAI